MEIHKYHKVSQEITPILFISTHQGTVMLNASALDIQEAILTVMHQQWQFGERNWKKIQKLINSCFCATRGLTMSFELPSFYPPGHLFTWSWLYQNICNKAINNAFSQSQKGGEQDNLSHILSRVFLPALPATFLDFMVSIRSFSLVDLWGRSVHYGQIHCLSSIRNWISPRYFSKISFTHSYFCTYIFLGNNKGLA